MRNIFKRPHPFIFNYQSILIPTLVTLIIIISFQPLGFRSLSLFHLILYAIIFSSIIAMSILGIVRLGSRLFPKWFDKDSWTILKEVILFMTVLISIHLLIFIMIAIFQLTEMSLINLWIAVFIRTLLFALFPIIIVILYEQYNYQKQIAFESQELNQQLLKELKKQDTLRIEPKQLLLKHENDKVGLQIFPQHILYIQSAGNYVEVFYFDKSQGVQRKLIRNKLKNILNQLSDDTFFHCHKSYIVNLKNIISVEGNARNFELVLYYSTVRIPVSRSKSTMLRQLLAS